MRTSPPIAPSDLEHATYLVLDDFGADTAAHVDDWVNSSELRPPR